MLKNYKAQWTFLICCFSSQLLLAHQPVMDMAPRWAGGYGGQVRYSSRFSDELLKGDDKVSNVDAKKREVNKLWLEGIYTFDRSLRVTLKVPYIDQKRSGLKEGTRITERGKGWGDAILALPLKKYTNHSSSTENISLTPQIRVPTGSTDDDYPVSDGSWDTGLSLSYSSEDPLYYTLFDLFYWNNQSGENGAHEGDLWGLDINLGYHPYHNNKNDTGIFIMADLSARHEDQGRSDSGIDGGEYISAGPILILYKKNLMARFEYHVPFYERVDAEQLSRGETWQWAIGATF